MAAIGTMTLTLARDIAAQAVIRDGSYDPTNAANVKRLDYAIQAAGQEFMNRVRCDRTIDKTLSMTTGVQTIDYSSVTGLKPENFLFAEIIDDTDSLPRRYRIIPIAYDDMAQLTLRPSLLYQSYVWAALNPNKQLGWPAFLSFNDDRVTLWLYPAPQSTKSIWLYYWHPFVSWTAGGSPTGIILNIPDDLVYEFLYKGVAYYYDIAESPASDQYGAKAKQRKQNWDEFVMRAEGSVSSLSYLMPISPDSVY